MPLATLILLVGVIGLTAWANCANNENVTQEGAPADFSRIPWFLRYNAPVRNADRHVMPVAGAPVATSLPVTPAGSGFAGFLPRVV